VVEDRESASSINDTLIVLIPKVKDPTLLTQFRPISLCNVIYKIASKVIANRLKEIMPDIISDEQSAFVPGRLITDNIIAAYECLHFMKRNKAKKNQYCALKLDMTKAYDRVEWAYLRAVLLKLGFPVGWVDIVMDMISSVKFSVLLNGKKLQEFTPSRGIRQGDPISPYLFLLAAEGLSCLLISSVQSPNLSGLQVAPLAPPVNHLLFADDSLLFVKANSVGAAEVSQVLEAYCQASGQRINYGKSSIYFSKGVSEATRATIKGIMNVPNETLNEKYLGMPSDVGSSKNSAFKFIKDRLWNKVQGWIEKSLSTAGKEILVKSVAQAVPVYSMSCFKLPRGLCEHLNMLIRKFWWGSKDGRRKPHWVSWNAMTQPKDMGGLGFKDFELFNLSLLARQAWRVLKYPNSLSASILKGVYFPNNDILHAGFGSHPSQIWRAIVEGRDVLKQGLIRRIGIGNDTLIWEDNWIPRDEFLRPYGSPNQNPPTRVSELISHAEASWDRQKIMDNFLPMDVPFILGIPICSSEIADSWAWHFERRGEFTVRSAYRMLTATKQRREAWLEGSAGPSSTMQESKDWKALWKVQVPAKIRMFLWRLSKQSLPTEDVRSHRNMSPSSCCGLCGAEDSWRHSLLLCPMARCIWAMAEPEIAEFLVDANDTREKYWLFHVMETLTHEAFIKIAVTLWAIWSARRKAIHEGIFQSPSSTHCFIQRFLSDLRASGQQQVQRNTPCQPTRRPNIQG